MTNNLNRRSAAWLAAAVLLSFAPWLTAEASASLVTHVPLYTFNGDSAGDSFGVSVSGAGDIDGDGTPDFVVGASREDLFGTDRGSIRVFSGATGDTLYTIIGDSFDVRFGTSVSGAGDVDGDGRSDLIVGAPMGAGNNGSARVISGATRGALYDFNGDSLNSRFGTSVSGLGDVDGDGFADLVVGAPSEGSGRVSVLSGFNGSTIYTLNADTGEFRFGFSVSGAGDVDGDGRPDLIVGAPDTFNHTQSSSARVVSGATGGTLYTFDGDSPNDEFGYSVSGAGDVNGDGFADLIVGARSDNNSAFSSGSARVFSGATGDTLYTFNGDSAADLFGFSVSGAGDVDGDGFDDLIVGAVLANNNTDLNTGSARVISGATGERLYNFYGDEMDDNFGFSVSGVGDLNSDGFDDFIVGTPGGGANDGGYARVFVSQVIPEPGVAALGLSMLALVTLRQRVSQVA